MMQFTGILCWDLLCAYAHVMVHKCNGSDCCHTVSYGVRLYRYNAAHTPRRYAPEFWSAACISPCCDLLNNCVLSTRLSVELP